MTTGTMQSTCPIGACDGKSVCRQGWCVKHYTRWRRHGDPLKTGLLLGVDPTVRFWLKVNKTGRCWIWTAAVNSAGYGVFGISSGRVTYAHRFAYEQLVGAIPDGLVLDHLCRTPTCVNPSHLEAVTQKTNTQRGLAGPKARCGAGHPMDDENVYVNPNSGRRDCRACHARRERERKARERRV